MRYIYNNFGVLVEDYFVPRTQSINWSFGTTREDISQMGKWSPVKKTTEEDTATISFDCYQTNIDTNLEVGLAASGTGIVKSGMFSKCFLESYSGFTIAHLIAEEGKDLINGSGLSYVSFYNSRLSSFNLTAGIGEFVNSSYSFVSPNFEALTGNVPISSGVAIVSSTKPSAFGMGDITVTINGSDLMNKMDNICIQSFSIEASVDYRKNYPVGERRPIWRANRPISATISIDFIMDEITERDFDQLIFEQTNELDIKLLQYDCTDRNITPTVRQRFIIKNPKLVSENMSSSIASSSATMSASWEVVIYDDTEIEYGNIYMGYNPTLFVGPPIS